MAYRVYFGRLPESLSQDEFEKMLEEHGKARNIEWKSGFAYVDYKHGSDASKTVQNLNGKEVGGNNILVELAQNGVGGYAVAGAFAPRPQKPPPPRPIRTPHRVRIENLSSRAKWMELKELVSLAGEVTFADTHKRKVGEGIVEFANRKGVEEAIKIFHNTTFFGKTIKLYDESPRSRSRSPVRQKSRSRSRHRSSEKKRRSHSKSSSPRRHRSMSPRRRARRRSRSKDRNRSRKRHSRSRSPVKSSRGSHKKSRKSRHASRSKSKSPRRKKHKYRSRSRSDSDNNNGSKRKSKTKEVKERSLSSSDSDNKST